MSIKRIIIITGTRADYGILTPVIDRLSLCDQFSTQLVVTGSHLVTELGHTIDEIVKNGHPIAASVDILNSLDGEYKMARATGVAVSKFVDVYAKLTPDLILVLGDRYESFAAAQTAVLMNIPVGHIHGGEISEGAVDDYLRHAISKLSDLHFCATHTFKARLEAMGEQPDRVHNVGAPGLDNVLNVPRLTFEELCSGLTENADFGAFKVASKQNRALVTYHPATREQAASDPQVLVDWIASQSHIAFLITAANADDGGEELNQQFEALATAYPHRIKFVPSLGMKRYLSALEHVGVVIGNSSSGLIEVPSFGIPTINIGQRQQGRLKPASVIDCALTELDLNHAINTALEPSFVQRCQTLDNPYGTGDAAVKIGTILEQLNWSLLGQKRFYDKP